jgi:hypothetical protein
MARAQDQVDPHALDQIVGSRLDVAEECLRAAQRLRRAGGKVIGLLPISPTIGVHAIGLCLGQAMAQLTGTTVAIVDANVRWPALVRDDSEVVKTRPDAKVIDLPYATLWLNDNVALYWSREPGGAGAGLPQLAALIRESSEIYGHFVVDLTGFKPFGEHLAAVEMVDSVVAVARVGSTIEPELRRISLELGHLRHLCVLLVGGRPA